MLILQKNSFNKKDKITNAGFAASMALVVFVFLVLPVCCVLLGIMDLNPAFYILSPSAVIIPGLCITLFFSGKPGALAHKLKLINLRFSYIPIALAASLIFLIAISRFIDLYHQGLSMLGLDAQPPVIENLLKNSDFNTLLWLCLGVVFLAPVSEELVFRRFMFGFLAPRWGFIPAMLVTAGAFAAIHLSLYDFPALFLLGIAFQVIYLWFGSLYPAILMHAFNNVIAVNALFMLSQN